MDVILSKNSVSVSKNWRASGVMCLPMFFSSKATTSGRFSRRGRGTFRPLLLSGMLSTLQYQSTLCATDANSLDLLIRNR